MAPPQRKCFHPSCRLFIPFTQTYCEKHDRSKAYDREKKRHNPEYVKFYSSTIWRNARWLALLRDDHLCVSCLSNGIYKQADMVDHIIPSLENWDRRLDQTNLQSLCNACHNKKTFGK